MAELNKDVEMIVNLIQHNRDLTKNGGDISEIGLIQKNIIAFADNRFGYNPQLNEALMRETHKVPAEFGSRAYAYETTLKDFNEFLNERTQVLAKAVNGIDMGELGGRVR